MKGPWSYMIIAVSALAAVAVGVGAQAGVERGPQDVLYAAQSLPDLF